MACEPERVTGHVDGELEARARSEMEAHLAACPDCAGQAAFERALRRRLLALRPADLPLGLGDAIRLRLRDRATASRWLLPVAAVVLLLLTWISSPVPALARDLARDHVECQAIGPASPSAGAPAEAAGFRLAAATHCRLAGGSIALHLQYVRGDRRISVFLVERRVLFRETYGTDLAALAVRLRDTGRGTLGVVGEADAEVDAILKAVAPAAAPASWE